jgi:hypothetical protein
MLMQRWVKKLNSAGQSIVEIGLVTPLVLIALYIPADFGIAMFTAHLTQNAVREAVRIAVSSKTPFTSTAAGEIRTEALNRMPARLSSRTATVNYYADGATCAQFVEVIGQGNYDYFFYRMMGLFGFSVPSSGQITRTARMRYEFQPTTNNGACGGPTISSP